jgi:putative copper resistance protein D
VSAPSIPQLLVSHWQPSWSLNAELALIAAVYLWAATVRARRWPTWRTISFLAGLGCVLVALESGVDSFDDQLLQAHMVQHMLLLMLAPLLLLGGRPVILALRALPPSGRRRLMRVITRVRPVTVPLVAVPVFWVIVIGTHIPAFYDATLTHPLLHDFEHLLFVTGGLVLYWPLLDGDPVPAHRLGGLGRLLYLLAAMPAMAVVGAYLNRHTPLVYPPYAAPARALGVSPFTDQAQAGAIMWVVGDTFMAAVGMWSSLAAMVTAERRQQAAERAARAAASRAAL